VSICSQLDEVKRQLAAAAQSCGRNPAEVRLVAVSKTRPAQDIIEAFHCGQTIFGENYVQELCAKAREVDLPVQWHFIGHLQSNKVKQIAGMVSMIHSVDRLSLAEEISRQWGRLGRVCDILIQVNISGEVSKSGTSEAAALELVRSISQLPNIKIRGLMTMPPFFDDPEAARPYFAGLRKLASTIEAEGIAGVEMRELSMGMSGDYAAAIAEGATCVRIGSAIFGSRN